MGQAFDNAILVTASCTRLTDVWAAERGGSWFRHLLLLLRAFYELRFVWGIAVRLGVIVGISHLFVGITVVTLVILVELLADFRLRFGLEVFVDALVVFICASTIGDLTVTRSEIVVL
jgi:hypothetical protein